MSSQHGSNRFPHEEMSEKITTVLVANRGEIALRILRTLHKMGLRSVAVYSDADVASPHVRAADIAVRIGPAASSESYLSIPNIVQAALDTGAQAIHPGYGFLAENAHFARACEAAGLKLIGPPAQVVEIMGDKITAKEAVSAAGVPVVPGRSDRDILEGALANAAEEVGYPLLLKPAFGGGGKGMRLVRSADELRDAATSARREAQGSFGDATLLVEHFVETPRHIEVQILADDYGNVIHLGERECSLQRRHQKIIEEAPSSLLDSAGRERIGVAAVQVARSVGYVGAGTVEFIVPAARPDEFFFMEMNTRLQVEHPVTEMITGLDLVEWQIRIAAGEVLTIAQGDVNFTGHAVEARLYAEDPTRNFLPTGGEVLSWIEPSGAGVRVDSWLAESTVVGLDYDPMLAKVIGWGGNRETALGRLDAALSETVITGVATNVSFLRALLADDDVRAGRLDTNLIERRLPVLTAEDCPDHYFVAASLDSVILSEVLRSRSSIVDPWDIPYGWRQGAAGSVTMSWHAGGRAAKVDIQGIPHSTVVRVDGRPAKRAQLWRSAEHSLELEYEGRVLRYHRSTGPDGALWLTRDGHTLCLTRYVEQRADVGGGKPMGPITSPMPGTILVVNVKPGDLVHAGDPLLVVEAMKMEHVITASADGIVDGVKVLAGDRVSVDEVLAIVRDSETMQAASVAAEEVK